MGKCLECKKDVTENSDYGIKFCSRFCSASYNNRGKRRHGKKPNNCFVCSKKTASYVNKFCSHKCEQFYKWEKKKKVIIKNGEFIYNDKVIKKYLLEKNGIVCVICHNIEWCGKPIPLILDHIDGNSNNKKVNNFRLVCGNCDMHLPTYKSKNKNSGRHYRRERYKNGKSY